MNIKHLFFIIRMIPIIPVIQWDDEKMISDMNRWKEIRQIKGNKIISLAVLLGSYPEFRNLMIYRHRFKKIAKRWIMLFYKPMDTLYIEAKEIGGGLYIQHGFATMITAEAIGNDCWINQQVTIGYSNKGEKSPIIGNNVMITCGAKVLGEINIGDNSVIGANAVVINDVEPDSVMVGIPARKVKNK